jgi:hypothetical protein
MCRLAAESRRAYLFAGVDQATQLPEQTPQLPALGLGLSGIAACPVCRYARPWDRLPCRREAGRLAYLAWPVLDMAAWTAGTAPGSAAPPAHRAGRVSNQAYRASGRISLRPLELTPGLASFLDRPGDDRLAAETNSDLLVDDLDHLLATTAPPLDGQHGIIEGTHCSTGRIGQARSLHAVRLIVRVEGVRLRQVMLGLRNQPHRQLVGSIRILRRPTSW